MIGGPFDAVIDPSTNTMTLFLKTLYAGRFDIQSSTMQVAPGEFNIVSKSANGNPTTPFQIGLSNGAAIHGVTAGGTSNGFGMEPQQASEVFAILSKESSIRILR